MQATDINILQMAICFVNCFRCVFCLPKKRRGGNLPPLRSIESVIVCNAVFLSFGKRVFSYLTVPRFLYATSMSKCWGTQKNRLAGTL